MFFEFTESLSRVVIDTSKIVSIQVNDQPSESPELARFYIIIKTDLGPEMIAYNNKDDRDGAYLSLVTTLS